MKIDVIVEGERKEIQLKGLKSRYVDELIELMAQVESDEDATTIIKYRKRLNELSSEISGLSPEELGELEADDKQKIVDYITTKIKNSMGFTKP